VQETSAINKGRYYVYGLFKPCGTPFYIGNGTSDNVAQQDNSANNLSNK
jgi:hypothetical protein